MSLTETAYRSFLSVALTVVLLAGIQYSLSLNEAFVFWITLYLVVRLGYIYAALQRQCLCSGSCVVLFGWRSFVWNTCFCAVILSAVFVHLAMVSLFRPFQQRALKVSRGPYKSFSFCYNHSYCLYRPVWNLACRVYLRKSVKCTPWSEAWVINRNIWTFVVRSR